MQSKTFLFKLALLASAVLPCMLPVVSGAQISTFSQLSKEQPQVPAPLIGSWLASYDVPSFGNPIPALLSFTQSGVLLESDYPGPTPFGGAVGIAIASNGHGAWSQVETRRYTYTYDKILYSQDGTQYGVATTEGLVTVNPFGTELKVKLQIRFTDLTGRVVFSGAGTATARRIVDPA